jgi:hypothetical protein
MNTRSNIVALALSALGVLAFSSLSASARIVCNRDGDCYPRRLRLPAGRPRGDPPGQWALEGGRTLHLEGT